MIGHARARRLAVEFVGSVGSPQLILGLIMWLPLLSRTRNNLVAMGMDPERLYTAMSRFQKLAERGDAAAKRVPIYQMIRVHAAMVVNESHPYHRLANPMVW